MECGLLPSVRRSTSFEAEASMLTGTSVKKDGETVVGVRARVHALMKDVLEWKGSKGFRD